MWDEKGTTVLPPPAALNLLLLPNRLSALSAALSLEHHFLPVFVR